MASVKSSQNKHFLKNIGKSVRERRIELSLSQEKLAEIANVHRNYVGKVERGEQNLTIHNLVRIAKALNCKASDIMLDAAL